MPTKESIISGLGQFGMPIEQARFLVNNLTPGVIVTDFANIGAIGNGSDSEADDTTDAFLAAIATGLNVFVPEGTYVVNDELPLTTAGQVIYGVGPQSIIKQSSTSYNLFRPYADNIVISDLKLYGVQTVEDGGGVGKYAIRMDAAEGTASRCRFQNLIISSDNASKGFHNGIRIDPGCDYNIVQNCLFERLIGTSSGNGYGVVLSSSDGNLVTGNKFFGGVGRGRHFCYLAEECRYNKVLANYVDDTAWQAININAGTGSSGPSTGNIIAENQLLNCVHQSPSQENIGSIGLFGNQESNMVLNNYVRDSYGSGITVNATSDQGPKTGGWRCTNIVVRGNHVVSCLRHGIQMVGVEGGALADNYLYENGDAGSYSQIQIKSDNSVVIGQRYSSKNIHIYNNTVLTLAGGDGGTPLELNGTSPIPENIWLGTNFFPNSLNGSLGGVDVGTTTRYEAVWAQRFVKDDFAPGGSLSSGASRTVAVTVTGAVAGENVVVTPLASSALVFYGYCASNNTVTVLMQNLTGAPVDPGASIAINIDVFKRSYTQAALGS